MDLFRAQCIALYDLAFPGEPQEFTNALFDRYFPDCIRTVTENGCPVAMLFSIPYPLVTEKGMTEAHYIYGVATHPDHRGKGLAKQLLTAEAERYPVFLRPMSDGLFTFYSKAGFSPISPLAHGEGVAAKASGKERLLSAAEYLALRDKLSPLPTCRPTEEFLSLYTLGGGFAAIDSAAAVLFEQHGDKIWFKEYWGDPTLAPALTAYLGGTHFSWRRYDAAGTPFGMACGIPQKAAFLAAMD